MTTIQRSKPENADRSSTSNVTPSSSSSLAAHRQELVGWAVALPTSYAVALRQGPACTDGWVQRGLCLVDLRCVPEGDDARLAEAVLAVAVA